MAPRTPSSRVLVGVFGAPHGVRGELRVKAYTAEPLALLDYGPLESEDGSRRFVIEAARPVKDDLIVARIAGLRDRDAAAALTNTKLYVDRSKLPEAEEDEFYLTDLVGLRVEDSSGALLGTVASVPNYGAGDLLEIALTESRRTVHLPFTRAFVPEVDIAGGRVIADPPQGWADEPEKAPPKGPPKKKPAKSAP
jgi:16S rRNA processing protein RimM